MRLGWYHIVLMDLQMPVLDGFGAARAIRELPGERGKVPIVAITAFATREEIEKCKECGMNDYVAKPINRDKLTEAVLKWSGGHGVPPAAAGPKPARRLGAVDEAEVLDRSVLGGLTESLGAAKTAELVDLYVTDIEARIVRLGKAAADSDFPTLRKEAHDLRSTSGSLGLTRLFALGEGIENACADGREADAQRLSAGVAQAGAQTVAALRDAR